MVSPAFFHCPSGLFCRYSIDHPSRIVFALGVRLVSLTRPFIQFVSQILSPGPLGRPKGGLAPEFSRQLIPEKTGFVSP